MIRFYTRSLKLIDYASRMLRVLFVLLPIAVVARLARKTLNSKWLIAERGWVAQDNGYALFRYLRTYQPHIDVEYVISKASSDYPRVAELGTTIEPNSIRHYWKYVTCSVAVSTHVYGACPVGSGGRQLRWLNRSQIISCIRHGVSKDNYQIFTKSALGVNHITFAAQREYDYYKDRCGYQEHEISLTGLCRYDLLPNPIPQRENEGGGNILFMPTFRKSVHDLTRLPRARRKSEFAKSSFARQMDQLFSSERVLQLLIETDLQFLVCPHPRLFPFLEYLSDNPVKGIELANTTSVNFQFLISSSKILVTDFSSVAFDFAYLGKPVVYWQTDVDEYRGDHYAEGYFSYEDDGFGPVVNTLESLVSELTKAFQRGCTPADLYTERSNNFFTFKDRENSQRVYTSIIEHPLYRSYRD